MKERTHQLWIPGFVTLILSMLFIAVLRKVGFSPRIVGHGPGAILLYVPWLLSLPLLGILGAYLSLRAGAARQISLLASVFPALALTTAFLLMSPIGWIIKRIIGTDLDFGPVAAFLLRDAIGWLLLPGFALLAGGLFLRLFFRTRPGLQHKAIS